MSRGYRTPRGARLCVLPDENNGGRLSPPTEPTGRCARALERFIPGWHRGAGNDISAQAPELSEADWRKLSDCLWDVGGDECGYRPLYTPCLSPGSGPQGDGFDATDFSTAVLPPPPARRCGRASDAAAEVAVS